MTEHTIRRMKPTDRSALEALLDEAMGRGFWDPAHDLEGIVLVAEADDRVAGVATASIETDVPPSVAGPVGQVRLVAVDPSARGRGIATRLVAETSALCESLGAKSLLAYAWVHCPEGVAPLAGALTRDGYVLDRRIEGFYAASGTDACPACGELPCVCPADVYRRDVRGERD